MSLEEIADEVKNCQKCSLSRTRIKAVPGEGNPQTKLLFIGEAPGQREDETGRPFVGAAGQFLESMLNQIGLERKDVFITNVVKCRPPQNRDPYPSEIEACLPYLKEQIKEINPLLIVTLGRYSLGIFLPQKTISACHGKIYQVGNHKILPLYHPAAALHNENLKETIITDFQKIKQTLALLETQPSSPKQQKLF